MEGWERKGTMRIEVAAYLIAARLVCLAWKTAGQEPPAQRRPIRGFYSVTRRSNHVFFSMLSPSFRRPACSGIFHHSVNLAVSICREKARPGTWPGRARK